VDNNNFKEEITSKPYLKYVYQSISKGLKLAEKEAFLKIINGSLNYLYSEHPLKKRGFCFLYSKKRSLKRSEK
jgi:hypothetical protein